jgi:hypothetical protein
MKRILKILLFIVSILFLIWIIWMLKGLVKSSTNRSDEINQIINNKLNLNKITSIPEIEQNIIPLSYNLIINKYPIFSNKKINKWYVLEPQQYKTEILKIYKNNSLVKDRADESVIGIDTQDAVTFCPPTIYLKYLRDKRSVTEYLIHSIHESFHALSCNSNITNVLPPVWEESMTDYLTLQTFENFTGIPSEDEMAFPYEIRVMKNLVKFIPEDKIIEIYLSKNTINLSNEIDERFSKGSYELITKDLNIIFTKVTYNNGFQYNKEVDDALERIQKILK